MVSRTGWILHSYNGVRPPGDPRSSICPAPSPEVSPPQRAVPCRRIRAPAARRLHPLDQKRPWNRGGRDPLQCAPHRVVPYAEQRVSIFAVGEAPAGVIGVRLAYASFRSCTPADNPPSVASRAVGRLHDTINGLSSGRRFSDRLNSGLQR